MKKHLILLAMLTSLSLAGCDALDNFFDYDTPSSKDDQGKDDTDPSKDQSEIESIYIVGSITKTEYKVGETWSTEGLSVGAKFKGDKEDAPLEEDKYTISFDSEKAVLGVSKIYATAYLKGTFIQSASVGYDVSVNDDEVIVYIESISIEGRLEKTHYYVGEYWSTKGLSVKATYSNDEEDTLDSSEYSFAFSQDRPQLGYDSIEITAYLLNGDVESEPVSYDVTVEEPEEPIKEIESLKIYGSLDKTFYKEGESWSSSGLTVKGVYEDDTEAELTTGLYYFEYSPVAPTIGVNSVTIQAFLSDDHDICSPTVSYDVTVRRLIELRIIGSLEQTTYEENEDWNFDGLQVEGTYNDSGKTSVILNENEFTVEYNPTKALLGTTSVSIKVLLNRYELSTTKQFTGITVNEQESPPLPGDEYTIRYDSNDGSGMMEDTVGESPTIAGCSFTAPDGYHFVSWNTNANGTGTTYYPGTTVNTNLTLYAIWEEDSSGDDTYYAECAGLTGSALQAKLKSINPAKNPSYDWDRYEDADEALDDSSCILSIYTRHNIKKSSHCGSYSWTTWNREHVWTQTKYPASKTDNHNIFACEGQINGYRSDKPFKEGGDTVVVFGHTTGCKQTNSTFEPCDEAKGEIARSVMYGTVMYSYTMTDEIDSIYLALKWHLEHPKTQRDIVRNDIVYKNQGNRNPFVDHPEYACKIWGNTNSQTKQICGM